MKFTLKNIKHSEFSSNETDCFQATVLLNGIPLCIASNDGQGGSNNYHPIKSEIGEFKALTSKLKEINSELSKEKIQLGNYSIPNDLDIVVGELLVIHLKEKQVDRLLKRISYVDTNTKNIYQLPAKIKPFDKNISELKKVGWWKSSFLILNEIPREEAINYI